VAAGAPLSTSGGEQHEQNDEKGMKKEEALASTVELPASALEAQLAEAGEGALSVDASIAGEAEAGADPQPPPPGPGRGAVAESEREAQKLRLLRCPFVEGIDLTLVPLADRVLLRPPVEGTDAAIAAIPPVVGPAVEEKRMGLRQLHGFIAEIYGAKKADDKRRDKVYQARRPLHEVMHELLRRQHGVKKVVHQKSWQLVEALVLHAGTDQAVSFFVDFLDGTRDPHELSFYLYCSSVLATTVGEEAQMLPPGKPVSGAVSFNRASRMAELLFGDLPKALDVMRAELDKCKGKEWLAPDMDQLSGEWADGFLGTGISGGRFASSSIADSSLPNSEDAVPVEELYRVLLEGWRMSALLLEEKLPAFSWRQSVLSFMQSDQLHRGWLDPHEVRESEAHRLQLPVGSRGSESLRILDQTSLGGFACRAFQRCQGVEVADEAMQGAFRVQATTTALVTSGGSKAARKQANAACLQISQAAFETLEKTLGVYLTWLMHSDELRDLAVYQSVKARLFGFRQSVAGAEAGAIPGAHHLRCLIMLLLAHQFDVQLQRGSLCAEHLDWELRSLLRVLRESWRRGAVEEVGPDLRRGCRVEKPRRRSTREA